MFEILALKKPAVLVPLQHGSRGDQMENAAYFEKKGLCRLLRESELDALYPVLCTTLQDDGLKQRLAESSITSGTQDILSLIAKYA